MPEGDSIFRAARALNKALAGKVVTGFETALAPLARMNDDQPIAGRTVERVEARGKWCLIFFSGDLILLTHMRMSGSWHIYKTGERWQAPHSAMRVVITCGDVQAVAFSVPVAEFHTTRSLERSENVPKLGIDVLGATYSVDTAVHALRNCRRSHPDAEIGNALLNQRVLAGIGNVYKSEIAFAASVNPFRKMQTISDRELEYMAEIAERYMRANVVEGTGEGIVTYTGNRRTTRAMDHGARLLVSIVSAMDRA
jgi:endonuclease-8